MNLGRDHQKPKKRKRVFLATTGDITKTDIQRTNRTNDTQTLGFLLKAIVAAT